MLFKMVHISMVLVFALLITSENPRLDLAGVCRMLKNQRKLLFDGEFYKMI
jgi:hypothetical protein